MELETTNLNDIKVWKTITIGAEDKQSNREVLDALLANGAIRKHHLSFFDGRSTPKIDKTKRDQETGSPYIPFFREHFIYRNETKEKVKLALIRGRSFLSEGELEITYGEMCRRANSQGLSVCPLETPIALALSLTTEDIERDKHLKREKVFIATNPFPYADSLISVGDQDKIISHYGHGSLRVHLHRGYSGYIHEPWTPFVFAIE